MKLTDLYEGTKEYMHAFKLAVEKRSVLCKTVISYGVITNFVLSTFNREKTRRNKCLISYPGSEGFVRVWTNRKTDGPVIYQY